MDNKEFLKLGSTSTCMVYLVYGNHRSECFVNW